MLFKRHILFKTNFMKKNLTRIILSFIAFVISIPCFAEDISIPTSLKGNWINTQTNEWEYGLFEKFAVYDCDFWNYTSIVPLKKNVLMINLENGEKSLSIKIKEEKRMNLFDKKTPLGYTVYSL